MGSQPVERRSPERERHLLWLLRRLAAFALATALVLLLGPRLLSYLGFIGPTAQERIAEAQRAIEAAQAYGARADHPAMTAARQELEAARRLAAQGHDHAARKAAQQAAQRATEAQAEALVGEGQLQRQASAVADDLDREINQIEELYDKLPPGIDRATASGLLGRMREARRAAGAVFLAYDEKRFADALARESEARRVVAQTRAALEAAKGPAPAPSSAAR